MPSSRLSDAADETDSTGSASTSSLRTVSISPLSNARVQTPPNPRDPRSMQVNVGSPGTAGCRPKKEVGVSSGYDPPSRD